MNIVVCVKQVPDTNNVKVDPNTGALIREGVSSKLNPYDLFALETAFTIKEKVKGNITTISMGPPQASASLLETLAMGADKAILLSDRKFAGSDVYATSYAIASGIKKIANYDLIICGKQTTDGDTAQVGPEIAETLGIEHISNVLSIDEINPNDIVLTFSLDNYISKIKVKLPCLITMDKNVNTPRLPSLIRMNKFSIKDIIAYTANDLTPIDETRLGLKGSPTQVERIFSPSKNMNKKLFEGDKVTLSNQIVDILKKDKLI